MIVEYVDSEPNGLAAMVGGLIEANLERDPERQRLLRRASIGLTAPDVGVAATLLLERGRVRVANGPVARRPDVRIRADSGALIELTSVPLRFGFPDVLTREGRSVVRKLLSGEVRVAGLVRHPRKLARLNMLLSVA